MTFTLYLYREGDRWFFDDAKKSIEHEEFVGGVPELLYEFVGRNDFQKCTALISTKFAGHCKELILSDEVDPQGGVYYLYPPKDMKGWLCPIFWDYFDPPNAPPKLWVFVEPRD
jgi:hypothetical protein